MHAAAPPGLVRGSTAEELAGILQQLIFSGELGPDDPMREAALAERYEVSRRTVREALSLLERAGLVRHHRHKGSRVTRLSAADIRDLYQVRRTLELAAAERAGEAPQERRAALTAAFEALAAATRAGRADEIVVRDLEFHQAVVGLLASARTDGFFAAVASEMRYALTLLEASYQESKRRPKAALAEHRRIYSALLAGDTETASVLIGEHVAVNERLLTRAAVGAR
jgi:DNA-binding GntR family transcriptional regulator